MNERLSGPWQGTSNGFDQSEPTGEPFDEVNHLANKTVTAGLIKRALSSKPDLRRDFEPYMRWIFHPVDVSPELVDKTEYHIRRKGNIFDASARVTSKPKTHGKP